MNPPAKVDGSGSRTTYDFTPDGIASFYFCQGQSTARSAANFLAPLLAYRNSHTRFASRCPILGATLESSGSLAHDDAADLTSS